MAATFSDILERLKGIRDERGTHANTATRIGTVLIDLLHYAKDAGNLKYLRKDRDDATPYTLGVGALTIGTGDRRVEVALDEDGNLRIGGNVYATGGVSAYGRGAEGQGGGSIDQQAVEDIVRDMVAGGELSGLTLDEVWQSISGAVSDAYSEEKVAQGHLSQVDTQDIQTMWNSH